MCGKNKAIFRAHSPPIKAWNKANIALFSKMRIYVILLSVISLYALSEAAGRGPSHSVTWGVRSYRDSHLRREIITEKSRFLRVVTKDYVFDQKVRNPLE